MKHDKHVVRKWLKLTKNEAKNILVCNWDPIEDKSLTDLCWEQKRKALPFPEKNWGRTARVTALRIMSDFRVSTNWKSIATAFQVKKTITI